MAPRSAPTRREIPVPVEESSTGAWLRQFRLSGFALTVLFLVIAALVVLAPSLKILVEQRAQIADLERERQQAQQAVDDLQEEVDRWSDPSFLKAQARDRLLYAFPGDITYLVVDDGVVDGGGGELPISDSIQTGEVDWVRSVLASIVSAGLSDAQPQPAAPAPQ